MPVSEQEREVARAQSRAKMDGERMRREAVRHTTRATEMGAREFIEGFVRNGDAARYPATDADLAAEAADEMTGCGLHGALAAGVDRALAWSTVPVEGITASTIAQWLLTSYDETYACDVADLPLEALRVDRLLAHLESFDALRAKLEPRVSASIARRAVLLLMNQSSAVESEPPSEPEPDEEPVLCVDCGGTVGITCNCQGG